MLIITKMPETRVQITLVYIIRSFGALFCCVWGCVCVVCRKNTQEAINCEMQQSGLQIDILDYWWGEYIYALTVGYIVKTHTSNFLRIFQPPKRNRDETDTEQQNHTKAQTTLFALLILSSSNEPHFLNHHQSVHHIIIKCRSSSQGCHIYRFLSCRMIIFGQYYNFKAMGR